MATSGKTSANDTLIKNLQDQVERLVEQLKDLEECENDLTPDEYTSMREDTVEQIKEFTGTLDRMNKGDISLNSTFSNMRTAIRKAISASFNTADIIKMFGDQNTSDLEKQLLELHENYKLKKINVADYEKKKIVILQELSDIGHQLSTLDQEFLDNKSSAEYLANMEQITDDG